MEAEDPTTIGKTFAFTYPSQNFNPKLMSTLKPRTLQIVQCALRNKTYCLLVLFEKRTEAEVSACFFDANVLVSFSKSVYTVQKHPIYKRIAIDWIKYYNHQPNTYYELTFTGEPIGRPPVYPKSKRETLEDALVTIAKLKEEIRILTQERDMPIAQAIAVLDVSVMDVSVTDVSVTDVPVMDVV